MGTSNNLDDEPEILETPNEQPNDVEDTDSHASDESETDAEDEDDYEDDALAIKKRSKKKFAKVLAELKSGTLDLQDAASIRSFVDCNAAVIAKQSHPRDQTLLHLLAESDKDDLPVKKIKALVAALVQLPENLLAEQDVDGKTPLFCAISLRNHKLVKVMCEAHKDVDSVLRIPKGTKNQGSNCLHQAITNKSSPKDDDLAEFLVQRSGPETLRAVDENGLTPLHLAVEYKRCDEAQPKIVRALVEQCDAALDIAYAHKDKGQLSPYRYHEHTYQEALEKQEKAAADAKKKAERGDGESVGKGTGGQDGQRASRPGGGDRPRPQANMSDMPLPQAMRRALTHIEAPTGKFGSGSGKPVIDALSRRTRIKPDGSENGSTRGGPDTPITKEVVKKKSTKARSSKTKPTEASAQEIRNFLKLYYLRSKPHDDAAEFLYGVQQDKQIYFDLFGCGATLSENRITEGWNHLIFEDIVQYVAIPQVRVEAKLVEPVHGVTHGKRSAKQDIGKGRTDLQILFKWLKENRGVKTILKVIVDDLQEPAHSDEAIEACLSGMGVETWDWRKTDICSEVIQKVSPDVRVVHLYWSGNNAVLRSWSEAEGLKKLKKLERVILHVQQGLESKARTKQYVVEFRGRLEASSEIKVTERKVKGDMAEGSPGGMDAVRDPYERHRWITTMEEFAEFLTAAERQALPPLVLKHPVNVAVIDDGVDINDQTIQSRIAGGRSFCHRDESENLNQPYYVSSGGHGTAMAGLICKVCPNVRLYILKLNEYYLEPGKRQITAKSAARAVRAAVDRKVDIISMSWTIEKTESNKDDIADLEKAIELAAGRNILMFCAAADQGAYKDRTYPAATGTKKIFKIGAAEASGAALKWLGDQSLVDFIFPGHQVVMERHGSPKVKQYTALTGSSVATALASGLAALILYVVQAGNINRDRRKQSSGFDDNRALRLDDYKALKNHDRMDEAFQQIGTTKESENKYITVWNRFQKTVKKSESQSQKDTWIDLVTELADDLMRED